MFGFFNRNNGKVVNVNDIDNLIGKVEIIDIREPYEYSGGTIKTFNDHRIAMSFSVANLISNQSIILDNDKCIDISFPGYFNLLKKLSK